MSWAVQIQALDGAIAAHMPQQDYASHDPAGLPAAAMQASAAATYHLQVRQGAHGTRYLACMFQHLVADCGGWQGVLSGFCL